MAPMLIIILYHSAWQVVYLKNTIMAEFNMYKLTTIFLTQNLSTNTTYKNRKISTPLTDLLC